MALDMLSSEDLLIKMGVFVLVQALVYLILSGSSSIFSQEKTAKRLNSFRSAPSLTIRQMLALLSDMPSEADPSTPSSATQEALRDQK